MAALESRLVITAADETAAAFAAVEARVKGLQASLGGLNTAIGAVGRASVAVTPAAQSVAAAPRPAPAAAAGTSVGETLLSLAATLTGVGLVKGGLDEAVARQHETMRQTLQNLSAEQMAQGERAAAELARKYPSIAQSDLMHLYRTGVTVTGSAEEAINALEPMARLRIIAQAARPHASAEEQTEEMDKLLKSAEIAGVATDPGKFKSYITAIAKTLNAFGDQLKPSDIFEQLKYARQASQKLSERFIATTMSTIGSEIGGASIGTATASFNRAMVGGHMEHQAALELAGLGLIKDEDLIRLKTGEVKGVKRGAHVQDWRLAQSDPDLWIKQNLIPALEKAGYKTDDEMQAEVSKLYPNRTAGQFVSQIVGQRAKMDKNAELWRRALADEAADALSKVDFHAAAAGLGNTIKGVIANQVPTNILGYAMHGLSSLISAVAPNFGSLSSIGPDLTKDMQGWRDVAKSIHVGAPESTPWGSPAAIADRRVASADWNARYFADEAAADAARERSRALALSGLSGGHAATPQDVSVHGEATVTVPIHVEVTASSDLLRIVKDAENDKTLRAQMPLNPVATGHFGRMDSDAAPGRGGIGSR